MDRPHLHPGQHVHVYAAGAWRPGRIIKTNRTRGLVEYVRNQAGDRSERVFPLSDIHPARGVRLVPARHLRAGMLVVLDTGDRTIDVTYRHEPRQRLIRFTDTTQLPVNAGTTLRVRKA
jgi:hypothetical protein